jgi:segregation and condensation protein A
MSEAADRLAARERAASVAAWEDPPRRERTDGAPVLAVDGFAGPLDWLLELARARKIDLARLSIAALIEAFAKTMTAALADRATARIEHWAAWTVLAASLTELWSRLLLPPDAPGARAAMTEAEALRRRLLERARMREAAAWLARQPQLGQDVFTRRGAADAASSRTGALTDLLRACLVALQVLAEQASAVRPRPPRLWQASDAIRHMSQRLATLPDGSRLDAYLPALADGPDRPLRLKAALASTVLAGLELARAEVLLLEQDSAWSEIRVTGRRDGVAAAAAVSGPAG